jgi:hypothetical protein
MEHLLMSDRDHAAALPTDGCHPVADLPPAVIEREVPEQGGGCPLWDVL